MERKRDGFVPVGDLALDLPVPVPARPPGLRDRSRGQFSFQEVGSATARASGAAACEQPIPRRERQRRGHVAHPAARPSRPEHIPVRRLQNVTRRWCTNTVRRFEAADQTERMKSRFIQNTRRNTASSTGHPTIELWFAEATSPSGYLRRPSPPGNRAERAHGARRGRTRTSQLNRP